MRQIRTHSILAVILKQHLIIHTEGCDKNYCRHPIEAMYPFLPFIPLTTDIEHAKWDAFDQILFLNNATGANAALQLVVVIVAGYTHWYKFMLKNFPPFRQEYLTND